MREGISVLQAPRGAGKTTWVMEQIHTLGVQNRTHEVLVVVQHARQREWWLREWREKYRALTAPMVVTAENLMPLRGRRYPKIFVEDVDMLDDGIYDEKLWRSLNVCLEWAREPEVVFTSSRGEQ